MIKLGLDFDNTLIDYDEVFYKVAHQKGLIPKNIDKNKASVRKYLVGENREEEFTLLQGEVYGSKILEAKKSEGMFEILNFLKNKGVKLIIVSHKTIFPYAGEKYNLHNAAKNWLIKNHFFDPNYLGMDENDVYFEITKEKKIKRIHQLNINFFIDDLESILEMINSDIERILYNPNNIEPKLKGIKEINSWRKLPDLIYA